MNWKKKKEKVFGFSNNCIWIRSGKCSQTSTLYLASPVNVLTNTSKISGNTRGHIFKFKFSENEE